MNPARISGILLFFVSGILFSCHKKNTLVEVNLGLNYFPATVGSWIIYDVDSTYYDNAFHPVSFRYQLKEIIDSTSLAYKNNIGEPTQIIGRYYRMYDPLVPYEQIPWTFLNVYTSNRTTTQAKRMEGTETFLKLVFPPKEGKKWNGNAYNANDSWVYTYSKVNVAKALIFNFDSTLTVLQSGLNDPQINTQTGTEIYAAKVGMIFKDFKFLQMQATDTSGYRYTMTINDYSH